MKLFHKWDDLMMVQTRKDFLPLNAWLICILKNNGNQGLTKDELIEKMDEKLESKYIGTIWSFSQPIIDNVNEAIAGIDVNQAVKVFGENLDTISNISRQVYQKLENCSRYGRCGHCKKPWSAGVTDTT